MRRAPGLVAFVLLGIVASASIGAAQVTDVYRDPRMDFGSIRTIAVAPFANLARDQVVAERVRDVFVNRLLATGAVYVLPVGEVARGLAKLEIQNPTTPTPDDVVKLGALLEAQAVITGVVREYGEVRSGTTSSNVISMSIQLVETGTGKIVWSASSTKGGISFWDRLIGGGGQPLNRVTEEAIDALFDKLLGPPQKGR
ncbi:MAG TPA: CsgG/HfaB family protein [Vicinamibacterales bacterium]|nr:CsgG/HfaB family protein [Vicinamibacterales bacterium]HOG30136.1 CsgG/HfaB family protein [Vicinamibacterales bacterium]HOQ60002.1 CsgG/HfaB family protein [Vicinamibacterales bacterium]HPK71111.1 CsgG/HfaB family protein [Vicinamibacterales bacterium]HPW20255.1 CsgG/HfaB family protein [Vicinamibacterales bacterium]